MKKFLTILVCLWAVTGWSQQPRVNGVTVLKATNGTGGLLNFYGQTNFGDVKIAANGGFLVGSDMSSYSGGGYPFAVSYDQALGGTPDSEFLLEMLGTGGTSFFSVVNDATTADPSAILSMHAFSASDPRVRFEVGLTSTDGGLTPDADLLLGTSSGVTWFLAQPTLAADGLLAYKLGTFRTLNPTTMVASVQNNATNLWSFLGGGALASYYGQSGGLAISNNPTTGATSITTSNSATSRITQTTTGVGLGTNAPQDLLHLFTLGTATVQLNGANGQIDCSRGDLYLTASVSSGDVILRAGGGVEKMRIDGPTGNVGIGTTAPDPKLDIAGTMRVQSVALSNFITGESLMLNSNISTLIITARVSGIVITLPTNTTILDGQTWEIVAGTEGTNTFRLTPTNGIALGTADKINRSTNWIVSPGETLRVQKLGTNYHIIAGAPASPIGTVIDFHKTFAGVPLPGSWWVECNGQTLNDPGSPLNGLVIPNLNNSGGTATNIFVRSGTSSGAMGGAENHTHTIGNVVDGATGAPGTYGFNSPTPIAEGSSHLPFYWTAVKLMRVK